MVRDWVGWHADYGDPTSSLSRRLSVVRQFLRHALARLDQVTQGEDLHITSMCAGDGRDVLHVLRSTPPKRAVSVDLIELDPILAERARDAASVVRGARVAVHQNDAGEPTTYLDLARADLLLVCGVFGNISSSDVRTVIDLLPRLLNDSGIVIWTRGHHGGEPDPSLAIRQLMQDTGFAELAFTAPNDAQFRVGISQVRRADSRPIDTRRRLFTFL
jgi:hypothetical protein